MLYMKKKEFKEKMDLEDKTLVNFNPELNQSSLYDNEGDLLPKPKREPYNYIPWGFINSGLFLILNRNSLKVYLFLSIKCNRYRNTRVTNEKISREMRISNITIKRALAELKFYHFIHRRVYSMGPKLKRRIITLLRWDTAYKLLVKEGKIKAVSGKDKDPIITPYLPNKPQKKYPF